MCYLYYMHIKDYLTHSKNKGKRQTDIELKTIDNP